MLYLNKISENLTEVLVMKKVKIAVLKTTLDKELVQEYSTEGLTACPMQEAGQFFMPTMQNQRAFVMKHGKQSISMHSL